MGDLERVDGICMFARMKICRRDELCDKHGIWVEIAGILESRPRDMTRGERL